MKPNPSTPTYSTLTTSAAISLCTIVAVLAGAAVVSAEPPQPPAAVKLAVRETVLATLPKNVDWENVFVSGDGGHYAYVATKDKMANVVLDGVPQPKLYPSIEPTSLRFSPDGTQVAYVVSTGNPVLTSLDIAMESRRIHRGFTAPAANPLEGTAQVVWGSFESRTFSHIDANSMAFSPDGKRFGFIGRRDGKWRAVIDGVETDEEHVDVAPFLHGPTIHFSPDSKRVAYAALRSGNEQTPLSVRFRWFVVVDGKKGAEYDRIGIGGWSYDTIAFSPDSKRLAFVATGRKDGEERMFPVLDGIEGVAEKGIYWMGFTPEGQRFVRMTFQETPPNGLASRMAVSMDGLPGKEFHQLRPPVYQSPDGSRIAFVNLPPRNRQDEPKASVVVDNTEGKVYRSVETPVVFTPDGRHFAYVAGLPRSKDRVVVVDGVAGPKLPEQLDDVPLFFADNNRLVTVFGRGRQLIRLEMEIASP